MRKNVSKRIVAVATAVILGAGMIGTPMVSSAQESNQQEVATGTDAVEVSDLTEHSVSVAEGAIPEGAIPIDEEHFPDIILQWRLQEMFDPEDRGYIYPDKVTELSFGSYNIQSLEGIEVFKNLEVFKIGFPCDLDISNFPKLRVVDIGYYRIGSENGTINATCKLNFSACPDLEEIYLPGLPNSSEFDMSGNNKIKVIELDKINGNLVKKVNVQNCTKLEKLSCYWVDLDEINVDNCVNLKYLSCGANNLKHLDVSDCVSLEELICDQNLLTELDVCNCPKLKKLNCFQNQIKELDISKLNQLEYLDCSDNQISVLASSDKKTLIEACTGGNNCLSVDWSKCSNLRAVSVDYTTNTIKLPNTKLEWLNLYVDECKGILNLDRLDLNIRKQISTPAFDTKNTLLYIDKMYQNGTNQHPYTWHANIGSQDKLSIGVLAKKYNPLPAVSVSYATHIQTLGDSQGFKKDGVMAGTSGMAKRLENIKISVSGNKNLGIQYSTHCQTYGWLPWSTNGEANGTSGEAKRLEAIKIQLTGADKDYYDVYYRVHAQSYGWLGWAKNGEPAGTAGYAKRLEGIQVVVVKKGEKAPGLDYADVKASTMVHNDKAYIAKTSGAINIPGSATEPNVMYKTHVQSFGWQKWVTNGEMSGTSGKAKRLEGINIKLSNAPYSGGIQYMTHIQSYGWEKQWKADGAMSGTSGEAKRLEAIKIQLTGEMAKHYDVYYRVHAQSFGWLSWAKNGVEAGTAGYAKRLEGIQIVLVPKGAAAPGKTYQNITSTNDKKYIAK